MGQGNARIFNFISILFLVLTIVVIVLVVRALLGPPATQRQSAPAPTIAVLPTLTSTNTATATLPPTATTTPTNTVSPTPTDPPTATIAPSATITETPGPTETPSNTPTPPESATPELTATPEGPTVTPQPTLSPFLFDLREGQIIFTTNFANSAGCAWQGIGGQVFDLAGAPLNGLRIHIYDSSGFDRRVDSGSNSLYGLGGWEQPVDNKINGQTYFVELESAGGTVVSPRITVQFPSDCTKNLALVNFLQVRDR